MNVDNILSRILEIEHGFQHILGGADEVFSAYSKEQCFEFALTLFKHEAYQARMLATTILGRLATTNNNALRFLKEQVSTDENWRVQEMLAKAEKLGKKLLLPVDSVTIKDFPNPIDAPVEVEVYDSDHLPADREGCDIGPKSAELFANEVKTAKTVVWNGPMGVFENPTLAAGTLAVAKALAETDATTIIGGGDSAAAVNQMGFGDKMSHISTGGGASLEFLEGKELPGVAAANDK